MTDVYALLSRLAGSDSTVLVHGESGTGKELVARALHDEGARARGPFVAINCAAMPEGLLESELFGHAKGAFTDAKTARAGLFVDATGGTLFLDEIAEMPLGLQAKLLRALQERTVRPIGQRKEIPFDVRLVVATNRDLETEIQEKRFREDLYFRINVVEVELPPLRSRGNDVLLLAHRFLADFATKVGKPLRGFTPDATKRLLDYSWPGNVRELQNTIERAVALAARELVTVDDLPARIVRAKRSEVLLADDPSELVTLVEMEARYIRHVLRASGGSKVAAAKTLGLDRTTLWRKLERIRRGPDGV
jgi:two-component system response regulator HydG